MASEHADWAVAEASAVLGCGCVQRALDGGRTTALDFWTTRDGDGRRLERRLEAIGLSAHVETASQDNSWRDALQRFHVPVTVSATLRIRPPWASATAGLADVVIDPGMAFGTAQHATTRACLSFLCALTERGPLIDVGCGSGVLAIAARRLGHTPVTAIDYDQRAVDATIANAKANGVELTVARRTVGEDRLASAPTILANLTLTVLKQLALTLPDPPPRHLILSGLRPTEAETAGALFARFGLRETARSTVEGWSTLHLAR